MAEHPNLQRLRLGYEAYASGDLATLRELLADDVGFHFLGHTPLSGDYQGLGGVLGYFERLRESGASFTFEVHALLADDEHGVGLLRGMAERAGRRVEQKVVHVFHLNAEGKVTDWWNFWEDQAALDALFG
jgi:ketosteroid isomerase-like protein